MPSLKRRCISLPHLLFVLWTLCAAKNGANNDFMKSGDMNLPVVRTRAGAVRGSIIETPKGNIGYAFQVRETIKFNEPFDGLN